MKVKKIDDSEYVDVTGKYRIFWGGDNWNVYRRNDSREDKAIEFVWGFRTAEEAIKFVEGKTE